MKNLLAAGLGILLAALLLVGGEYTAREMLARRGLSTYPLLLNNGTGDSTPAFQQNWGRTLVVSYLDPLLGFAHDPASNPLLRKGPAGFVRYPARIPGAPRIVALGGSTTDPLTPLYLNADDADPHDPYNWPRELQLLLRKRGQDAEIYNGGVAGYTSSQELLKLLRDVVHLGPDLVIAVNGINDIGNLHRMPGHPLQHKYSGLVLEHALAPAPPWLMPNAVSLAGTLFAPARRSVTGVSYGPEDDRSPETVWHDNCLAARALAEAFGMRYVVYLQPTLGVGGYSPSAREAERLAGHKPHYVPQMHAFYEGASALAASMPFCTDLSDAFARWAGGDVYLDARHYNHAGTRLLAGAILDDLVARGLLPPAAPGKATEDPQ